MRVNRFDYLEISEETTAELLEQLPHSEIPPQREIRAEVLNDGTALAQVRIVDPRGYFTPDESEEEDTAPTEELSREKKLVVVEVFGERGDAAGEFNFPTGMSIDSLGVLFVADSYNHRIQRITPDGGVSVIGSRGQGRGQFLSPQGMAVDKENAFYIVEQGNHRVQKYSQHGVLQLIFGRSGRGIGELQGPTGIAIAPVSGDIYVADTGNSRIQHFASDGHFLGTIGQGQSGEIISPQALATDLADNLYVADTFAQRVVRFDPLGRKDYQWGGQSSQIAFAQPRSLALDRTGLLYVADGAEEDVSSSVPRGRVQCIRQRDRVPLASLTTIGRGLRTLMRPGGLAVGPNPVTQEHVSRGDLYVADTMNHRILRFSWN